MIVQIKNFKKQYKETAKGALLGNFNVVITPEVLTKTNKHEMPAMWVSGFKLFKRNADKKLFLLSPSIFSWIGTDHQGKPLTKQVDKCALNKKLQSIIIEKAEEQLIKSAIM